MRRESWSEFGGVAGKVLDLSLSITSLISGIAIVLIAFSWVIEKDAGDARAIKGLLGVAERVLDEHRKPETAVKIYRYLKQRCAHSPLIEFIEQGLADAERKLPAPAGV